MLRDDCKKIVEQSVKFQEETIEKASKAGLHWVLCLWESPFNKQVVEKRVGYFEDIGEADHMKDYLEGIYKQFKFPFFIRTSYDEVVDGGLFYETTQGGTN